MVGRGKILDFRFFFFLPFFSILFLKDSCWFWCLGNLDEWMEHSGFRNKRSTCITQPQTFMSTSIFDTKCLSPLLACKGKTQWWIQGSDMTLALDCHCWFLAFLQWALSCMLGVWNITEMEQQNVSGECFMWGNTAAERNAPCLYCLWIHWIMCCFLSCYFVQLDSS